MQTKEAEILTKKNKFGEIMSDAEVMLAEKILETNQKGNETCKLRKLQDPKFIKKSEKKQNII